MIIYLMRHGMTEWNKEKRYQGQTDMPLSKEGLAMLKPLALKPQKVYVSPLFRTQQTAERLFPGVEQMVIHDLKEMDFGKFEGKNFDTLQHDPEYQKWVDSRCTGQCPGGECRAEFTERVCSAFIEARKDAKRNGLTEIAVTAHGGTQMAVLGSYAKESRDYWQWQTAPGGGWKIYVPDGLKIRSLEVELLDTDALAREYAQG